MAADTPLVYISTKQPRSEALQTEIAQLFKGLSMNTGLLVKEEDGENSGFETSQFFSALKTEFMGHVLVHAAELPSTQDLWKKHEALLSDGSVCVALRQTSGRGRRDNRWESPPGCLMFSVFCPLDINPTLSPFLNYVVCIAIIRAIKSLSTEMLEGHEVDVKIKWPNDIYYGQQKIGGVLLNSSFRGSQLRLIVGIGLNVFNDRPTTCLEEIFKQAANASTGRMRPPLSPEEVLAAIVNAFEPLLKTFVESGFDSMEAEYIRYWMHSDQRLVLESASEVRLKGITKTGFLLAVLDSGEDVELMPDGNTIDMLQGLIVRRM